MAATSPSYSRINHRGSGVSSGGIPLSPPAGQQHISTMMQQGAKQQQHNVSTTSTSSAAMNIIQQQNDDWINIPKIVKEKMSELQGQLVPLQRRTIAFQNFEVEVRRWVDHCTLLTEASDDHRSRLEVVEEKLERSIKREEKLREQIREDHRSFHSALDGVKGELMELRRTQEETQRSTTEAKLEMFHTSRASEEVVSSLRNELEKQRGDLSQRIQEGTSSLISLKQTLLGDSLGGGAAASLPSNQSILGRIQRLEQDKMVQEKEGSDRLKQVMTSVDSQILAMSNRVSILSKELAEEINPRHHHLHENFNKTFRGLATYVGYEENQLKNGEDGQQQQLLPIITSTIATSPPLRPPSMDHHEPHPGLQLMQATSSRSVSPQQQEHEERETVVLQPQTDPSLPPIFSSTAFLSALTKSVDGATLNVSKRSAETLNRVKVMSESLQRLAERVTLSESAVEELTTAGGAMAASRQTAQEEQEQQLQAELSAVKDSLTERIDALAVIMKPLMMTGNGGKGESTPSTISRFVDSRVAAGLVSRDQAIDEVSSVLATIQDRLHALAHHAQVMASAQQHFGDTLGEVKNFVDPFNFIELPEPEEPFTEEEAAEFEEAFLAGFEVRGEDSPVPRGRTPKKERVIAKLKAVREASTEVPSPNKKSITDVVKRFLADSGVDSEVVDTRKKLEGSVSTIRRDLDNLERALRATMDDQTASLRGEIESECAMIKHNLESKVIDIQQSLGASREEELESLESKLNRGLKEADDRSAEDHRHLKSFLLEKLSGLQEESANQSSSQLVTAKQQLRAELENALEAQALKSQKEATKLATQVEERLAGQIETSAVRERSNILSQQVPAAVETLVEDKLQPLKRGLKSEVQDDLQAFVEQKLQASSSKQQESIKNWTSHYVEDQCGNLTRSFTGKLNERAEELENFISKQSTTAQLRAEESSSSRFKDLIGDLKESVLFECKSLVAAETTERRQQAKKMESTFETVLAEQVCALSDEIETSTTPLRDNQREAVLNLEAELHTRLEQQESYNKTVLERYQTTEKSTVDLLVRLEALNNHITSIESNLSDQYATSLEDAHLGVHNVRSQIKRLANILGVEPSLLLPLSEEEDDDSSPSGTPVRSSTGRSTSPPKKLVDSITSALIASLLGSEVDTNDEYRAVEDDASSPSTTKHNSSNKLLSAIQKAILNELNRQLGEIEAEEEERTDGAETVTHEPGSALSRLAAAKRRKQLGDANGSGAESPTAEVGFTDGNAIREELTVLRQSLETNKVSIEAASVDIRARTEELETRFLDIREEWLGFKRDQSKATYTKTDIDEKLLQKVDVTVFNNRLASKFNRDDVEELRKVIGADVAEHLVDVTSRLDEVDFELQERVTRSQLNDYLRERNSRAARASLGMSTPGTSTPRTNTEEMM